MLATVVDQSEKKQWSHRVDRVDFVGIRLRPVWTGSAIEPVDLPTGRYTLGAGTDCDIPLPMAGVADRHCLLVVGRKRVIIKSFSPLTWINEGVISESELSVGDRLVIGPAEFAVEPLLSRASTPKTEENFSPPDINELIQQAIRGDSRTQTNVSSRREQLMKEMLSDVQGMLDQFFRRERDSRTEIASKNQALADAQMELEQEAVLLDVYRQEIAEQQAELSARKVQLESIEVATEKLQALREEVESQAKDVSLRESEISDQKEDLVSRQEDVERLQTDMEDSLQGLQRAQDDLDASRLDANEDQVRSDKLDLHELQIQEELSALKQEREACAFLEDELNTEAESLRIRSGEFDLRLQSLQERESELDQIAHQLETQQQSFLNESQTLAGRISEFEIREESLRENLKSIQNQQSQIDSERELLRQQKESQEKDFSEQRDRVRELETKLKAEATEIEEERLCLSQAEEMLRIRHEELQLEAEFFTERISELNDQQSDLESQEQSRQIERETFAVERQQELDTLDQRKTELENESQELKELALRLAQKDSEIGQGFKNLETERIGLAELNAELQRKAELLAKPAIEIEEKQSIQVEQEAFAAERQQEIELIEECHAEIEKESQELAELSARLAQKDVEISQRFDDLEAERRELEELTAELQQRENATQEESKQLEEREYDLIDQTEQLVMEREGLARQEIDLSKKLAAFEQERQEQFKALDEEKNEIIAKQQMLCESQNQLNAKKAELQQRTEEFDASEILLSKFETELRDQEAAIQADMKRIESRESELNERLQSLESEKCEVDYDRNSLDLLREELALQTEELHARSVLLGQREASLGALHDKITQEEKENWHRFQDESGARQLELDSQSDELLKKQGELVTLREELDFQYQEIIKREDLSKAENDRLDTKHAEVAARIDDLENRDEEIHLQQQELKDAQDRLAQQEVQHQSKVEKHRLSFTQFDGLKDDRDATDCEESHSSDDTLSEDQVSELTDYSQDRVAGNGTGEQYSSHDADSSETSDRLNDGESRGPSGTGQEPEQVEDLQTELAEIFGVSISGLHPHHEELGSLVENDDSENAKSLPLQSEDTEPGEKVMVPNSLSPQTGEQEKVTEQEHGDNLGIVEASKDPVQLYMEQLLVRNRVNESSSPQAAQMPQGTEALGDGVTLDSPKHNSRQEPNAIRADLDSFRELANLSARSAVAKSSQHREEVIFKILGVATGLGWLVTAGIFSVELWSTSNYRSLATVLGISSVMLSARMFFSYISIKKLDSTGQASTSEEKKTETPGETQV